MKAIRRGRLARIDGTFGVGNLDDVTGQNSLNGQPTAALNIRQRGTLESGDRYAAGEVATREEDRVEVPEIHDDGEIELAHEDTVVERYSAWAVVPGRFAVTWEDFALDELRWNLPVQDYREQQFDLNRFFDDRRDDVVDVTSIGFRGRRENADKGTVHGQAVHRDAALRDAADGDAIINELRVSYLYDGVEEVSLYAARSGYVELYDPEIWGTEDYLDWVESEVAPYLGDKPEEDDDV